MRRQVNIYVITMAILGGLLATSLVLKVDASATAHAVTPAASAPHQQEQSYISTHHDFYVQAGASANKL